MFNGDPGETPKRVRLGATQLEVRPVGVGTWQWGASWYWGFGRSYGEDDVMDAFRAAVAAGLDFFDTAEVYGRGTSERMLGRAIHELPTGVQNVIASKFFPWPWRLRASDLSRALDGTLNRIGLPTIGLYQLHFPNPPRSVETWAVALAGAVKARKVTAVGISNCDVKQMRRAFSTMESEGVPLATNQVGFSLLNRSAESSGLLDACRELGVTPLGYGTLGEGLLGGRYSTSSPPPLLRRIRYARHWLKRLPSILDPMREVASAHDGASLAQVAVNWSRAKGVLPIVGVKSARQATDLAASLRWDMSEAEMDALDRASNVA